MAEGLGVDPGLVERWRDQFVAGGRDRLAGDAPPGLTAHDFLSPLTIIRGWAETLIARPDLDPPTRASALTSIQRNALILERLARDHL